MPSVTGRVCYHPCETACNRAEHDEPIGIRSVERFLGDFGLQLPENPIIEALPPLNGKTVAIVGSGPGGLACAYHLRRRGYASVIFEAMGKPGGMLRGGIPHWHLPEQVLDAEIAKLLSLGGIDILCGVRAGTADLTWDDLRNNYDAAFLALGQDVGRRLDVPGRDARGVTGALEFLREAGLGRPVRTGQKVLVIGGGNTASDAARSAIRIGGGTATIVSLEAERRAGDRARGPGAGAGRGRALQPEHRLHGDPHRGRARDRRDAVPGPAGHGRGRDGAAGDRRGHRVPGRMRRHPDRHRPGAAAGMAPRPPQSDRGLITADEHGRVEGNIFVGGDVLRGPSMVVDALGDGKRAARDIDRLLTAQAPEPEPPVEVMPYERLNSAYFRHAPRIPVPLADPAERRRSQTAEVTLSYSRAQAVAESDRCMSCGVCNGCDNCYIVCPDVSVLRDARENGRYSIRTTYCKGCLVCVQECPTGCLEKVPELDFDEPDAVTRMETAFAPYDGAHAEQSAFTRQLIEESIAAYDAERKVSSRRRPRPA